MDDTLPRVDHVAWPTCGISQGKKKKAIYRWGGKGMAVLSYLDTIESEASWAFPDGK